MTITLVMCGINKHHLVYSLLQLIDDLQIFAFIERVCDKFIDREVKIEISWEIDELVKC